MNPFEVPYTRKTLINELVGDDTLLNSGLIDEEGGSDSEPSEDNMDEEERAKIIPIKQKPKSKQSETTKKLPNVSPKKAINR